MKGFDIVGFYMKKPDERTSISTPCSPLLLLKEYWWTLECLAIYVSSFLNGRLLCLFIRFMDIEILPPFPKPLGGLFQYFISMDRLV
jgi:hypothetical protein